MRKLLLPTLALVFLFSFAFSFTSQVLALDEDVFMEGPWDGEDTNPELYMYTCCYVPAGGGCTDKYGVVTGKQPGDGAPHYICTCNPEPEQNPRNCPTLCPNCW